MALNDLTSPEAVERALDEFDEIGREAFLNKYRFGHARRYFVRRNGKYYDSKAIAGAAMGFQDPQRGPLRSNEFSGGEQGSKAKLEQLGFDVVPRPPLAGVGALPMRDASCSSPLRRISSACRFSTIGRARSPRLTSSSSRAR
jgi:hypothetical protein